MPSPRPPPRSDGAACSPATQASPAWSRVTRVRILFVSSRLPYPPWQGDRMRAYHFLRLLARRHAVVLVTPMRREERGALEAIRPFCERIEIIEDSRGRGALRLLASPFTQLPFQTLYCFPKGIAEKVRSLLREGRIDLVHLQTLRMAPAAPV